MKVHVIFYSMYGHIYKMAEAVVEGAKQVAGAQVSLFQVAEIVSPEVLAKSGADKARSAFAHVPIADPKNLWVEALAYDDIGPDGPGEATAIGHAGPPIALSFLGTSRALRQHASVVHFSIPEPPPVSARG